MVSVYTVMRMKDGTWKTKNASNVGKDVRVVSIRILVLNVMNQITISS